MKIRPMFAWYDMWVGAFWDGSKRRLYLFPIPCIGLLLQFRQKPDPFNGRLYTYIGCGHQVAMSKFCSTCQATMPEFGINICHHCGRMDKLDRGECAKCRE